MDIHTLKKEAEALIRPAQLLVPGQGEIAGYWHGFSNPSRCIVVSCSNTWIEVGTNSAKVVNMPVESSVPLTTVPLSMLPPIDAIFAKGSDAIDKWLRRCNWKREWGYNDNFADSDLVHEYESEWQKNFPLYTQSAHAVMGGWHFPWPDDDWYDLINEELVVWTLAEAEPWIEV